MGQSAPTDRRHAARATLALALANLRYWTTVAPTVRRELARWEQEAQSIVDPELRTLALSKLHDEGFHAEAAAMLATLAPRAHRRCAAEAIIALELLFDYLDGLTERPSDDPLCEGQRMFSTLVDAVGEPEATRANLADASHGYLESLSRAVSGAIARLPSVNAISHVAQRTAALAGEAQTRMHAVPSLGTAQLEQWARTEAEGTGFGWRELTAGAASSVLVLHALIAVAADPHTTAQQAAETADAYLSTCVLLTLLDGLVDHEQDTNAAVTGDPRRIEEHRSGASGYLSLYRDRDELADTMVATARRAVTQARALPGGARHLMILVGVVAYYGSEPGAAGELARPVVSRLRSELAPMLSPTLAVIRTWRRTRGRARREGAHRSHEDTPGWRSDERRELA
jgi:tetraprenyl-beta-curcumene synthase